MHQFAKFTSSIAGQAKRLARDQSGATAIEYAMIASGVGAAVAAAIMSLGTATQGMYDTVVTAMK
jgi:pilus assembly protein Flp/PilA